LTSAVVLGGLAGCAGPNGEPSPSALPTTSGATETGTHVTDTQTPGPREIPIVEPSNEKLALEPPFPETKREIADHREQVLSDHYEKHGNPETDEPTRIASIQELATKAQEDDVHVKMDPGTYPVTIDNYADIIEQWTGPWDNPRAILFHFSGSNSYYDLRDVTITVETRLFNRFPEVLDVDGSETGFEDVVMSGSDSIIRGLTVEDVEGDWAGHPARTARTLNEWGGTRNLLHDVTITSRGSRPYGYGRLLGKGANTVVHLNKHSCWSGGGFDNDYVGVEAYPRSYGHVLTFGDIQKHTFIDCHFEGEIRSTNDILAETSGLAFENDFETSRHPGKIQPGYMISMHEGCFRTYFDRASVKVLGCTIDGPDGGFGLGGSADFADVYAANTTWKNCTGITMGLADESRIRNCRADVRYAPALVLGHWRSHDVSNVEVDLTIVPSPTPDVIEYQSAGNHFNSNKADNPPFATAYISGSGHDVVLRKGAEDLQLDAPHHIVIGRNWHASRDARDITLENHTGQPILLKASAQNCDITTNGPVTDRGSGNEITRL
jgi:hypothetical protein